MDYGETSQVFVLEDFLGYTDEASGPPGAIVDRGEGHTPYRSRGFQIDRTGTLVKSSGYSHVAQLFNEDAAVALSQYYGLHYWKAGGAGSTIVLTGSFGILRSRSKKEAGANPPYMLRFEALTQNPSAEWADVASVETGAGNEDGSVYLFGNFAEYQDRLYYCNGLDWPIRIDSMSSVFAPGGTRQYSAMGVWHHDIDSDVTCARTKYLGYRADSAGENTGGVSAYAASIQTKFGESPARLIGPPMGTSPSAEYGTFSLFKIDWSNYPSYVLGVKLYRVPVHGTVAQYLTMIPRGDTTFLDTAEDGDLGYGTPMDTGLPSNFRLLCTFEDRMFGVGGYGNPNRVACSKAGFPDVWPPVYELNMLGNLGSRMITRLMVVNGNLYFFLDEGILRVVGGTPENFQFIQVSDFVGCIAPRSMFPWQDGVVFLSKDGLYLFNGTKLTKISPLVSRVLASESVGSTGWQRSCGAVKGDHYYFSYRDDSGRKYLDSQNEPVAGDEPNRTLVVNMVNGRMGVIDDWAFALSTPYEGSQSLVIGHDPLAVP